MAAEKQVLRPEEVEAYIKEMFQLTHEASGLAITNDCQDVLRHILTGFIARQKGEDVPVEAMGVAELNESDPMRPHFGPKQVRSALGLKSGMRLRICGLDEGTLRHLDEGENIRVSRIRNTKNPQGVVTLLSSPYAPNGDGHLVVFVSYVEKAFFSDGGKISHAKIYLFDLSVVPRPGKSGTRWAQNAWLETL